MTVGTATGPTVSTAARNVRGPVLVVTALVVVAVLTALVRTSGEGGRLDPASYTPAGARAVAELLRDAGVEVQRVDTVQAVQAADRTDVTVVVPFPQALAPSELELLAELAAPLVLVGPEQPALDELDVPVEVSDPVEVERRQPACQLPVAERAGDADLGGPRYEADGVQAVGCYASGGRATLLVLPAEGVTLLGDGRLLTNERLDDRGNAALALGLLGQGNRVLWLIPRPGRVLPGGEQPPPLSALVADEIKTGALWLLVVAAVLALWRARRLGREVEEPLPVVVRAAEALRTATRERVARRVGMPVGAERAAVVEQVAARARRDPAVVDALLYGGPPADDPALVRLADDLRSLEQTLQEVAGP